MVAFTKFNVFATDVAAGTHASAINGDSDTLKVYLTNTQPVVTNTTFGTPGEITMTNCDVNPGGADVGNTASPSNGVITVTSADTVTFTASGGAMPTFQFAVLYNSTSSNKLIGWWDNGSSVDLAADESFTVDFGASLFTVGA